MIRVNMRSKIVAEDILIFLLLLLLFLRENKAWNFRQIIYMKFQALFSIKNNNDKKKNK